MAFYVTTPIYYVNAAPHLGHAYTTIGADVMAAERAGARGVLVPNRATRPEEVREAVEVAGTITEAVDSILAAVGRPG